MLAFALHLAPDQQALPFMVSSAPPDGYPRIDRVWRGVPQANALLAAGDRIVRVGDEDLRGVTAAGFNARANAMLPAQLVPLTIARDGKIFEVRIAPFAHSLYLWSIRPFAVTLALAGLLLLVRAREWPLRRRFFAGALLASIASLFFGQRGGFATYAWVIGVDCIAAPLAIGLNLWTLSEWTEAARPARRWQLLLAAAFAAALALGGIWTNFLPAPQNVVLEDGLDVLLALALFALVFTGARSMRKATSLERRQGRWMSLGFCVALLPIALATLAVVVELPPFWSLSSLIASRLAMTALPLSILVSIVAYQWLDIDRLIGASATYTLLGVGLLGSAFVLVPRVAASAGAAVGLAPGTSQVLLSMLLAAVAVPLYRAARPWVDRLLLAERFAVDRGFEALLGELPGARDPADLVGIAGEAVTALLRPESCVIYSRSGEAFEPLFVRGKAVPPAFERGSPLVGALAARSTPLVASRFAQRDLREKLSPFDRAALETLATAAVVPVRRRGELVAFLALGPKRSGDIYSPADLTLLSAVSGAVSNRLERFDDEEVAREARAMQQELRRYVPGAVARVIESTQSLEPREQAVSVLFVDIRGYAAYAESRAAHEIFSTVNRYTTAVSGIVEKHGGAVVEFNGDGMMAVFGAPLPLPTKERAAVAAAQEIVETLERTSTADGATLSVGVGIATGSAYVGAVQAVDRRIWTALGNTTNLAARLQALTRELGAAIVVDAPTWRAAGSVAGAFELRAQVPIRGRAQREDLYLLPLAVSG
jgi:class 3 adenylate cyclase